MQVTGLCVPCVKKFHASNIANLMCPTQSAGLAGVDAGHRAAPLGFLAMAGRRVGQHGRSAVVTLSTPSPTVVTLTNLTVSYQQHPAVRHLSGSVQRGSLTAVVGPNGAGKSTLLKSILGLLPVQGGSPDGRTPPIAVLTARQQVGYLPQVAEIDRNFPIHVLDCVLLGLWGSTGAWGAVSHAMLGRAQTALAAVGLEDFGRRSLGSLSSGQLQRVLFARLLVQDAELILLDEPFNAVDAQTSAALLTLVQQWHRQQRTVVAVLHDDALVRQHFPTTLLLARELIAWGPTAKVLTAAHWQRARAMAETWDNQAALCQLDPGALA